MFSFEAVWIIPMTLVLVFLGILLIGYGVFLDDFLLSGERNFILSSQKTATVNGNESEEVKLKEKNFFVLNQLELELDQTWSQNLLNGKRAYANMRFKGIEIHRIRMGLITKYGEKFFQEER